MTTVLKNEKTQKPASKTRTRVPERIINNAPRRFTDADFPIGTVSNQGDLIFVRIPGLEELTPQPRSERQLAVGNTQGSRHVLKTGDVFDCDPAAVSAVIRTVCPRGNVAEQYIGPVFQAREGDAEVTHPEHGHHIYERGMTIACVYQRCTNFEGKEKQVVD